MRWESILKESYMNNIKMRTAIRVSIAVVAGTFLCLPAFAQDKDEIEEVMVTGSRIKAAGIESSSPITSINAKEIMLQQEPEIEKILRNLPITVPGDGQNTNNGTAGAATVNLRGLGSERNLILMNGRRMTPYNYNGRVDTQVIPTALVRNIDILTGGASSVYGSDAIAGAINFQMKNDFEGVDLSVISNQTGEGDGETNTISLTMGSNLDDGRGNVAMNITWADRNAVKLGDRPLGLLGIRTSDGSNYDKFLAGDTPTETENCSPGTGAVTAGGSTTSIPTAAQIVGGSELGQFRDDRTLNTDPSTVGLNTGRCSVFNFNPFNYYQTPQEKYSGMVIANYEISEAANVYSSLSFSNVTVVAQIAPSGTFGQPFNVPVDNFFLSDQARTTIIDAGNALIASGEWDGAGLGWKDTDADGTVNSGDYLPMVLRRRTLELGPRSENYDTDHFNFMMGVKGDVMDNYYYDVGIQYGETNRTGVRAGYTNLTNIQNALDSTDGVTCKNGDSTCVPIDLFGGYGTITPAMAGYAQAISLYQQKYDQLLASATFGGQIAGLKMPGAESAVSFSVGYEHRQENGAFNPDECLKLAPNSCLGGAGGNQLPISGGFKVDDIFVEALVPILDAAPFAESLVLELGYRASDYDLTGSSSTWKAGLNWRPFHTVMFRVMQQQAQRAPNVGELFSPVTSSLGNATQDPCSVANSANIDAALSALCISTGMTAGQVGAIPDIISGQISLFGGSDPAAPASPEEADTFTAGVVWTPETALVEDLTISADYYDIKVNDYIGEFTAQEILDQCYESGITKECAKINRIGGGMTISGAGINTFTTNLDYLQAEGIDVSASFGMATGDKGYLTVNTVIHKYLTQESLSTDVSSIIDCKGYYSTKCNPIHDLRLTARATWSYDNWSVSTLWRHMSAIDLAPDEAAAAFAEFQTINSYDYFDLFASYQLRENITLNVGVDNVLDEDPPVIGNGAGTTAANSGNTFPSSYDTMGQIFTAGFNVTF
jgi:outer membrane receptor protein involved in Fe transport